MCLLRFARSLTGLLTSLLEAIMNGNFWGVICIRSVLQRFFSNLDRAVVQVQSAVSELSWTTDLLDSPEFPDEDPPSFPGFASASQRQPCLNLWPLTFSSHCSASCSLPLGQGDISVAHQGVSEGHDRLGVDRREGPGR